MPYKKKKQSRKTTQSQRQRQSQRQSVVVNIGSKSSPRKKRRGGGGGGGGGGLPPPSHMHNLAPTFVTSPQIDYTPILAMLSQQTRSLQPEPFQNPVTPLSSVHQSLPAEQMAGEAAIRRAGPTAGSFQPVAHMARDMVERRGMIKERYAMGSEDFDAPSASSFDALPSERMVEPKSPPSSPRTTQETASSASTQVALPSGFASISRIKEMGAAEERGRVQREQQLKQSQQQAFTELTQIGRQSKIELFNETLERMDDRDITLGQQRLLRQGIMGSGINFGELSRKAQIRTRAVVSGMPRKPTSTTSLGRSV
jgi:hypothetical protein